MRDDVLTALADAAQATDLIIHQMIVDELAPVFALYERGEDEWAAKVRDASAGMTEPEHNLAEIESELAGLRAKLADYRALAESPLTPREDRINARSVIPAFEAEVTAVIASRDQAWSAVSAALKELNTARDRLRHFSEGKVALTVAMASPFATSIGQATSAYQWRKMLRVSEIILTKGPDHPEWDAALDQLDILARASGYRTDHISAEESGQVRKMWDAYRDEKTSAVPEPSGAEVISAQHKVMERIADDRATRHYADDRRGVRLPPRNAVVPDYMRTARSADIRAGMGRR